MKISELEKQLSLLRMEYGDVDVGIRSYSGNCIVAHRLKIIYSAGVKEGVADPKDATRFIPSAYIDNHPQPFKTQLERLKRKYFVILE